MPRKRYTEEQIVAALRQAEAGMLALFPALPVGLETLGPKGEPGEPTKMNPTPVNITCTANLGSSIAGRAPLVWKRLSPIDLHID